MQPTFVYLLFADPKLEVYKMSDQREGKPNVPKNKVKLVKLSRFVNKIVAKRLLPRNSPKSLGSPRVKIAKKSPKNTRNATFLDIFSGSCENGH